VHRLDKVRGFFTKRIHDWITTSLLTRQPTTGVLVLARYQRMAHDLAQQFKTHAVEKTYLALVRGGKKTFPTECGEIRNPLQINDGHVSMRAPGNKEAKPAYTFWNSLRRLASFPRVLSLPATV